MGVTVGVGVAVAVLVGVATSGVCLGVVVGTRVDTLWVLFAMGDNPEGVFPPLGVDTFRLRPGGGVVGLGGKAKKNMPSRLATTSKAATAISSQSLRLALTGFTG